MRVPAHIELKAFFQSVDKDLVSRLIEATPLGKYSRRLWFIYEWLLNDPLDIPNIVGRPTAIDILDTKQQIALAKGALSQRHRIRNNLPGTPGFCPLVWKTDSIRESLSAEYNRRASDIVGRTHPDLVWRAAASVLLSDSRSSFEIEGIQPTGDRAHRWGQAIAEAGVRDLTMDELVRLQRIVIGDSRFINIGFRRGGGFVGSRDRLTREPIPDHISARPQDLPDLIDGLLAFEQRSSENAVDSVISAAILAFGFVYIHPFEDGNGRIHRWLIHHMLAKEGFNPPGVPFPISASILRNLPSYRAVLESYSSRLLPLIRWKTTERKNVQVLNDTIDYYRYFDATPHAEFLFECVRETVEKDLPEEIAYLEAFDRFEKHVQQIVDMPADTVDLLHRFLHQNDGRLSRRARSKEFARLTPEEVSEFESLYRKCHLK